jgi:GH24 family phage-related lysozyme (muramidase)
MPLTAGSGAKKTNKINAKGLEIIKDFEGCQLKAYVCPSGVLTIGYGHTGDVYEGQTITQAQAEQLLKQDILDFEQGVERLAGSMVQNDDQFSALVSFAYNVGLGALANSTLLRLLNQGKYSEAADQFLRWNKGDGEELPGLTRRRKAERSLFLSQDYRQFLGGI